MKVLLLLFTTLLFGCNQQSARQRGTQLNSVPDPHTLTDPSAAVVRHLNLELAVDFATKELTGKASWVIENLSNSKEIVFDTKNLSIQKVTIGKEEHDVKFALDKQDSILGSALRVPVEATTTIINIYYNTQPNAGALQWLAPQQTAGKQHPFLLTQSQPILARSWIPCQDGPGIRFTYNATVRVPPALMAVMSAENKQQRSDSGIYYFKQTKAIPSYLLALAVGDLAFQPIDSRTGVYAEPVTLKKAAYEFADMGKMVTTAEKLYGPYRWGRYDVLVLPPSFPYGGMENPNLTFLTPTVIAGDRSLVSVVAHELAHSWSGNLVTNATWNDMWLNEGFTTYFERRIVEEVYGVEEAKMQEVLGRQSLSAELADKGASNKDTKLKGELAGRDPDAAIGDIAYEKGYAFIRTIEEAVGRNKLDTFLRQYFDKNAFQSQTTEQFLVSLKSELLDNSKTLADSIRINDWVYQPGIPNNAPAVGSNAFRKIDSLVFKFRDQPLTELRQNVTSTNEKLYLISRLPVDLIPQELIALDKAFAFTNSGNAEIQTAWYVVAIKHGYRAAYPAIEKFLTRVGRRKFLVPIYTELIKTAEGKTWAKEVYKRARPNYHPVAYNTIDALLR
ncbi:M1 family peptidase [Segetibacter sp. 3557_3]|uniref:M1 family metallopeptidase n=1 Tax=Segetibacter sp. 3557_3 TaxID=2547429 RepID=UPI00105884A7|nr:M1 family metallopeptidase [Segetibacter sp. 3557_3]TDH26423.1 M1 family peptidase [Segetibacter sp. 3557_3]